MGCIMYIKRQGDELQREQFLYIHNTAHLCPISVSPISID